MLTLDQIESMIDAVDQVSVYAYRDKALIDMMYACGARISELSLIKLSSFDRKGLLRFLAKVATSDWSRWVVSW